MGNSRFLAALRLEGPPPRRYLLPRSRIPPRAGEAFLRARREWRLVKRSGLSSQGPLLRLGIARPWPRATHRLAPALPRRPPGLQPANAPRSRGRRCRTLGGSGSVRGAGRLRSFARTEGALTEYALVAGRAFSGLCKGITRRALA